MGDEEGGCSDPFAGAYSQAGAAGAAPAQAGGVGEDEAAGLLNETQCIESMRPPQEGLDSQETDKGSQSE